MALHEVGEPVRIAATFAVSGTNTDPTAVEIHVIPPTGAETVYYWPTGSPAASKQATGIFYANHTADVAGRWRWYAIGTGAAAGRQRGSFRVRAVPA